MEGVEETQLSSAGINADIVFFYANSTNCESSDKHSCHVAAKDPRQQ